MGEKAHVVVVGGGFGGAYFAQEFERLMRPGEVDITLFDCNNYFAFLPLIMEAGTGSLEPRHAVVGIRNFLRWTRFRMARVVGVDPERQEVFFVTGEDGADAGEAARAVGGTPSVREYADSSPKGGAVGGCGGNADPGNRVRSLHYDQLVLSPGSVTRLVGAAGLAEHHFRLKTLGDAVLLRDHVLSMLELADQVEDVEEQRELLTLVVVGSNYTGIEVAGEMEAYLSRARQIYRHVRPEACEIHIVEIADRLLPSLDEELAVYAGRRLESRGVQMHLGTTVEEVFADRVVLRGGREIRTRTLVWCAGVAPPELLGATGLPVDERGYLDCERDLRVKGYSNVWGIGDAAVNRDAAGAPYPPTAQHAVREAGHLAQNVRAVLHGRAATACDVVTRGWIVPLGRHKAVAMVGRFQLAGGAAWWLWRTFYLFKMPGWGRRARVALDWTLDLFSPPDYVQLGGFGKKRREEKSSRGLTRICADSLRCCGGWGALAGCGACV